MSGDDRHRDEDDDLPTGEFTESEKKKLRKILRDQERMTWLWSSLRIWAVWVSAAVTFFWTLHEYIFRALKALFTGDPK